MFQQWLQLYMDFCRERIVHVKYLTCHDRNTFRENFLNVRLKYCRLSGKGNGFQKIEKEFSACGLELYRTNAASDGFLLLLGSALFGR